MQLTIDIGYDELFELVRQLPTREKERLAREVAAPERNVRQSVPESRQEIERCRQEALRLALEGPVATPEEIEAFSKFRRQFRCRPK